MHVLFHTLGCKVNQYETQAMRRLMEQAGFSTSEYNDMSNISKQDIAIVINSCTVTGESDRKLRQLLRRLRRLHPHAVIILTGCMPQAFPEVAKKYTEADIVLGNASRSTLVEQINRFLTLGSRIVEISSHNDNFESLSIDEFRGRTRAFVKIEDGCDRYCSYCIIPYARGNVRSKPLDELALELQNLANNGFSEIVLVGINLTSYGREWHGTICDAVEIACSIPNVKRVRLGSLEPDSMTPEVIAKLSTFDKLCPQFHLSLQSGSAKTLKRMNRHYTPSEYQNVCKLLKKYFPDCALTTDVMVGFPGEDETEFDESLLFVKSIGFLRVHVFSYSPRPGTPAAKASNQIPSSEKTRRSHIMKDACNESRDKYLDGWMGRQTEVLIETQYNNDGVEGYSPQYFNVRVCPYDNKFTPGQIVRVKIVGHTEGICHANLIQLVE